MEISENLNIPNIEKENIDRLASILYGLLGENLYLEVVGGAVTKKWPRKDIDIVFGVDFKNGRTELEKAENSLINTISIVSEVEEVSNGYFQMGKVQKPYRDHQYDDDDILSHSGSVELIPQSGTTIELVQVSNT